MDYNNVSFIFHSWMVTKLNLSSNELVVYMAINSFTQGQAGRYYGGLRFLEKVTGASRSTVIRSLNSLVKKGFVIKEEEERNNIIYTFYSANPAYTNWGGVNLTPVSNCTEGGVNLESGGVKMEQNNKYDNKCDNEIEKKDINSSNDSFISKESEGDCDKPKKRSSGVMPSREEVEAYIAKKGYHFSVDEFIRYYTCDGELEVFRFRDGRLVKDWHRCCVTFEDNWKKRHGNQHAQSEKKPFNQFETDWDDPELARAREKTRKLVEEMYRSGQNAV